MYSLLHARNARDLVTELGTLAVALVVAELFYKFHSFSLECLAFLATWYVLGAVTRRLGGSPPDRG